MIYILIPCLLLVVPPLHKLLSMCNKLKIEIMTFLITFSLLHFSILENIVVLGNRNNFPCKIYYDRQTWFEFVRLVIPWCQKVTLSCVKVIMALWFSKKVFTFFETHTAYQWDQGFALKYLISDNKRNRWNWCDKILIIVRSVWSVWVHCAILFVYFTITPSKNWCCDIIIIILHIDFIGK